MITYKQKHGCQNTLFSMSKAATFAKKKKIPEVLALGDRVHLGAHKMKKRICLMQTLHNSNLLKVLGKS